MKRTVLTYFLILSLVLNLTGQTSSLDSLKKRVETMRTDEEKVYAMNAVAEYIEEQGSDLREARSFSEKALSLAEKNNYKRGIAMSLANIGYCDLSEGNYESGRKSMKKAVQLYRELGEKDKLGALDLMIGSTYFATGNYPDALSHYYVALKEFEQSGRKEGMLQANIGIGNILVLQKEFDKAIGMYAAAEAIAAELKDKNSLADCEMASGVVHFHKGEHDAALKRYMRALDLRREVNDQFGMTVCYTNIAEVLALKKEYYKALDNCYRALVLEQKLGDKRGVVISYGNIGAIHMEMKEYGKAKKYLDSAALEGKRLHMNDVLKPITHDQMKLDSLTGNWKGAYEHFKESVAYSDSLVNQENTRKLVQQRMQFEFDRMQTADSLKAFDEKRLSELTLRNERAQRNYLYGGLALVLVFAGFIVQRFRITQKQKVLIELKEIETQHQKLMVEQKQKEVLDSIHYARRIQKSLLPTDKYIEKKLKELNK